MRMGCVSQGLLAVVAAVACLPVFAQSDNLATPNFYTEPGGNPTREEHDWAGTETVDPATGALILRHRDLCCVH